MRRTSAPSRTASATAATVPHSRSPGGSRSSQDPAEHGADEVLARERDVERQPQRPQLAEPPQDLQVLVGTEVEVESGVDGDLLLGDAKLPSQLDSPLEPGPEVVDDVAVLAPGPVDPRRPLDVHQHVAAAALRDELEHLLRAAGDVVDRVRARVQRPPRHLRREGVGGDRHLCSDEECIPHLLGRGCDAPSSPATAGTSAAASSAALTGGPLFAATAPTSSISKPASTSASPSATACSGVPLRAPSNIESTVTLTIPAASG